MSLVHQSFKDFNIIFIDNASTDDSLTLLKLILSEDCLKELDVKIIENKYNAYFCGGNNQALSFINSEYVALLNNDTYVSNNWLEELVKIMDSDLSIGACQSKIVLTKTNQCHYGLLLDHFCQSRILSQVPTENFIQGKKIVSSFFYPSGAAVIFRKSALDLTGHFDEKLFFGDYDICWRMRLYGYQIMTSIGSTCYHLKGQTAGHATRRLFQPISRTSYVYRERLRVILKNYSLFNLCRYLPLSLSLMSLDAIFKTFYTKKPFIFAFFSATHWNISIFKNTIYERSIIQKKRVISDKNLKNFMEKTPIVLIEFANRVKLRRRQ
jgi:GT2 family glycosyltransferase